MRRSWSPASMSIFFIQTSQPGTKERDIAWTNQEGPWRRGFPIPWWPKSAPNVATWLPRRKISKVKSEPYIYTYITLHHITSHHITLHYITSHHITLHYIHTYMCIHIYIMNMYIYIWIYHIYMNISHIYEYITYIHILYSGKPWTSKIYLSWEAGSGTNTSVSTTNGMWMIYHDNNAQMFRHISTKPRFHGHHQD